MGFLRVASGFPDEHCKRRMMRLCSYLVWVANSLLPDSPPEVSDVVLPCGPPASPAGSSDTHTAEQGSSSIPVGTSGEQMLGRPWDTLIDPVGVCVSPHGAPGVMAWIR